MSSESSGSEPAQGPSVSLALGSGGARGLAHIGVIDVLLERGYRINGIAGCSMGALIGGVFAAGKLDVYREWVCALERTDIISLMDISFGNGGLLRGNRIMDALRELIGDVDIGDLPMKYVAVATDLNSRREVWINKGPLFDAIRSSIAIPTLFTPVEQGGRTLVDGGLLNPLPVSPTLSDITDLTIAVDLSGSAESGVAERVNRVKSADGEKKQSYHAAIEGFVNDALGKVAKSLAGKSSKGDENSMMDVVNRSFEVMQVTIARHNLASHPADLVIRVPRNACRSFDFHKAAGLIKLGRELTEQALE